VANRMTVGSGDSGCLVTGGAGGICFLGRIHLSVVAPLHIHPPAHGKSVWFARAEVRQPDVMGPPKLSHGFAFKFSL
jgi:hypothetical protein